jgi:hypothetical protein
MVNTSMLAISKMCCAHKSVSTSSSTICVPEIIVESMLLIVF